MEITIMGKQTKEKDQTSASADIIAALDAQASVFESITHANSVSVERIVVQAFKHIAHLAGSAERALYNVGGGGGPPYEPTDVAVLRSETERASMGQPLPTFTKPNEPATKPEKPSPEELSKTRRNNLGAAHGDLAKNRAIEKANRDKKN